MVNIFSYLHGNAIYLFYLIRSTHRKKYEKNIIYSTILVWNQSNSSTRVHQPGEKVAFFLGRKPWLALDSFKSIGSIDHSFLNEFDVCLVMNILLLLFCFLFNVQFSTKHVAIGRLFVFEYSVVCL